MGPNDQLVNQDTQYLKKNTRTLGLFFHSTEKIYRPYEQKNRPKKTASVLTT